ncbi:hypothetical protein EJ02DRAFT_191894 [Clathrospora elynae]|uniref:C2H2-type domain-containing protein n=1 Tax=Clathrospora elynae TaxID=706981 RepID=A0A6A5SMA7_9PLEO|nr:hypothetical protein EJ02DRAFT_191894 [Clathrospora elynae]
MVSPVLSTPSAFTPQSITPQSQERSSGSSSMSCYPCKAPDCSKHFSHQRKLKNHAKTHQRKTYVCETCPAQYPHAKSLREHRQTKHQNMRYYCDVEGCGDFVAQKKNMKRHKESKHAHP